MFFFLYTVYQILEGIFICHTIQCTVHYISVMCTNVVSVMSKDVFYFIFCFFLPVSLFPLYFS